MWIRQQLISSQTEEDLNEKLMDGMTHSPCLLDS